MIPPIPGEVLKYIRIFSNEKIHERSAQSIPVWHQEGVLDYHSQSDIVAFYKLFQWCPIKPRIYLDSFPGRLLPGRRYGRKGKVIYINYIV